jgi:hypothetical protein
LIVPVRQCKGTIARTRLLDRDINCSTISADAILGGPVRSQLRFLLLLFGWGGSGGSDTCTTTNSAAAFGQTKLCHHRHQLGLIQ